MRTLIWDIYYGSAYYKELADASPFPLHFNVDVRQGSITELDYPDNTFDLIVSHEVFEHLSDVSGMLMFLYRVMKPECLTYIYVHNYTSLSGGHHIAWKYPDLKPSAIVPPWDHLRQDLYPEIPSWLNRLREWNYRQIFEERFDILDWFPMVTEGEALLTQEIRAELSGYSSNELLTKGFVAVARPKKKKEEIIKQGVERRK